MAQSLFGLTPEQIQQARQLQQQQAINEQAKSFGMFGPLYAASRGLSQTGINALAQGLFPEAQDPALRRATTTQAIVDKYKGQNINDPSVLSSMAMDFSNAGLPDLALQIGEQAAARKPKAEESPFGKIDPKDYTPESLKAFIAGGSTDRSLLRATKKEAQPLRPIEVDTGDRIRILDPITLNVVREFPKTLTPNQQRGLEDTTPKVGFNAKTGSYTNQYGEIFDKTEMRTNRQGFTEAEKLLEKLNSIDADTIKQAESMIDYTEGGIAKTIGSQVSPKTVGAQTKIAAAQLLEQIEKLPPGSASDADMRAAVRDFPGYGDAQQLANWVNRTKESLSTSLARQQDLYGFRRSVVPTPAIDLGKPKTPKAAPKPATQSGVPAGVPPDVWGAMTKEERALWQ